MRLTLDESQKMGYDTKEFLVFLWRITAVHMVTYFIIGVLSMVIFNYQQLFSSGNLNEILKPINSPWVSMGPMFQVFRGLIFAVVLWPLKSILLFKKNGWFLLWSLFIGLSILSTFGPSISSIEGFIYLTIPIKTQLAFLPELLIQSCLLSYLAYYWYQKPNKAIKILAIILIGIIVMMSIAGVFTASDLNIKTIDDAIK